MATTLTPRSGRRPLSLDERAALVPDKIVDRSRAGVTTTATVGGADEAAAPAAGGGSVVRRHNLLKRSCLDGPASEPPYSCFTTDTVSYHLTTVFGRQSGGRAEDARAAMLRAQLHKTHTFALSPRELEHRALLAQVTQMQEQKGLVVDFDGAVPKVSFKETRGGVDTAVLMAASQRGGGGMLMIGGGGGHSNSPRSPPPLPGMGLLMAPPTSGPHGGGEGDAFARSTDVSDGNHRRTDNTRADVMTLDDRLMPGEGEEGESGQPYVLHRPSDGSLLVAPFQDLPLDGAVPPLPLRAVGLVGGLPPLQAHPLALTRGRIEARIRARDPAVSGAATSSAAQSGRGAGARGSLSLLSVGSGSGGCGIRVGAEEAVAWAVEKSDSPRGPATVATGATTTASADSPRAVVVLPAGAPRGGKQLPTTIPTSPRRPEKPSTGSADPNTSGAAVAGRRALRPAPPTAHGDTAPKPHGHGRERRPSGFADVPIVVDCETASQSAQSDVAVGGEREGRAGRAPPVPRMLSATMAGGSVAAAAAAAMAAGSGALDGGGVSGAMSRLLSGSALVSPAGGAAQPKPGPTTPFTVRPPPRATVQAAAEMVLSTPRGVRDLFAPLPPGQAATARQAQAAGLASRAPSFIGQVPMRSSTPSRRNPNLAAHSHSTFHQFPSGPLAMGSFVGFGRQISQQFGDDAASVYKDGTGTGGGGGAPSEAFFETQASTNLGGLGGSQRDAAPPTHSILAQMVPTAVFRGITSSGVHGPAYPRRKRAMPVFYCDEISP